MEIVAPHTVANQLLASLPTREYERLAPHLKSRTLRAREVLQRQGEPIEDIYFFSDGACSLLKVTRDGQTAEVASIGREGTVGAWAFFGDDRTLCDAVVYGSGASVEALDVDVFRNEMEQHAGFYNLIIRYSQALTAQLMQTTVCNGLHSAEERCCRWLLTTHDRLRAVELPITHDFVASVLGVRRPTVTIIFGQLLKAGIIEYRRGFVTIRDHHALGRGSCECYEQISNIYHRLLPEVQLR